MGISFLFSLAFPCKAIDENNRMGKTRDLSKKIRATKGKFHAKMGTMKDRNGMDLKKQKILRRGGKNTQKNYTKKDLHDPDNYDSVITHLEPDILECEIKWALTSGLQVRKKHHYEQSYWRIWNSSWAVSNPKRWCFESSALSMPANLENSAVATGMEKLSFHSNPKERQC